MTSVKGLEECGAKNALSCACGVGDDSSVSSKNNGTALKSKQDVSFSDCAEKEGSYCKVRSSASIPAASRVVWKQKRKT